jgi:hypothetical protein
MPNRKKQLKLLRTRFRFGCLFFVTFFWHQKKVKQEKSKEHIREANKRLKRIPKMLLNDQFFH